jgi:GNAT superfamily N-acetyltransferase
MKIIPLKSDVSFFNIFIDSIYNKWYDFYISKSIKYEDIVSFYKDKIDNVFILAQDQEFIGCYSIYQFYGLIADILIIKKYRGKGYGRMLINDVLYKLRYNLFSYLYCEDKNITLYQKYGFIKIYKTANNSYSSYNLMVRFNMVMIIVVILLIIIILIILSKFF